MRMAAKVSTGLISRFFKRGIYLNIKANVVCMSNCCRRTVLRRLFIIAHLGLQHAKAIIKTRPRRKQFIDMREAANCFKGPIYRYLHKRFNNAVKGISAIIMRCGPRQAICARLNLILCLQARVRGRGAYLNFYVPLTMAKRLQRVLRRRRVREGYIAVIKAGLRLTPYVMTLHDRINYEGKKKAVQAIQAVRHFQKQRVSYVKCRQATSRCSSCACFVARRLRLTVHCVTHGQEQVCCVCVRAGSRPQAPQKLDQGTFAFPSNFISSCRIRSSTAPHHQY